MKINTVLLITMFVAAGSLLSAQGLKVEPGTCIKVETGTTLNISGGGNLFLESDATGDASLIDLGSVSYTEGGEARVERYLTNGKWHMISSPVSEAVSGMFKGNYLQYHTESTNLYTDIIPVNTPLNIMQGYALWTVDAQPTTELFTGTSNTRDQSFNFTKSGLGWNLVGNPYPSVLDWDKVAKPAHLSTAIWLFDPTMGENGDYKYYISGGGVSNTTTQFIPSGQGFFVRASGGAGTLTFDNSDRTHGGQLFYKATQSNQMLVLKATGNNITTQTAIRFIYEATPQIDRLFDVSKIISNSNDVPNVYTKCQDEKMAINTLPSVTGHETVSVYFEAGMDGTYVFDASEIESLDPEVPVFLEDVAADYFQNLRTNPQYGFAHTSGVVKQFNIHFKDVTGIDDVAAEAPAFQCLLNDGILKVIFLGSSPFKEPAIISIYNLAGQRLLSTETSNMQTEIAFNGTAGLYLVHIRYNQSMYSAKVFNR
jgi:hypothetical protein